MTDNHYSDLQRLASFPEQNPNPVVEGDLDNGDLTYLNPAARKRFPDLEEKKENHPLFKEILKRLSERNDFICEVTIDDFIFEQKVFFIAGSTLVRVYSNDITQQKEIQKKLARLASFPEQNPSPIIEIDVENNITYFNPAFNDHFPGFVTERNDHPVFRPVNRYFEKLINGEMGSYEEEINFNGHVYVQRGRFLSDSHVIRIFCLDISEQKQNEAIIREKNKDITDSINYAKKIQQAILPEENKFLNYFEDSFILYKPKDIISGDFYWFTELNGYILFACADCTGHGVPGALMSMIGSNILTHIVSERNITSPADALMELDRRVRTSLKQENEFDSKDGMDLAFCSVHKEKMILHYSGANRPLILIRNISIEEIVPDKFAIGGSFNSNKKFTHHKLQLQKGDRIYTFTDGFADQFGGPKGKKMMKKNLLAILLQIHLKPMQEQKEILLERFTEWKGSLEQVDDVCIMGFGI